MPVRCVAVRIGNTGDSKKGVQTSKKNRFSVPEVMSHDPVNLVISATECAKEP